MSISELSTTKDQISPILTISELRKKAFWIPFYQRGYRWRIPQVEQLLDDIHENTEDKGNYCLQPIVVAESNHETDCWELIDGQQRLTTLNLVLMALNTQTIPTTYARTQYNQDPADHSILEIIKTLEDGGNAEEAGWDRIKNERKDLDTVDNHHMVDAWLCIRTWLRENPNSGMETKILEGTNVIWHVVKKPKAASEFLRFNSGRIPLSPCELLKAKFLSTTAVPGGHRSPAEIAAEWDQMESVFHDEEFWNFLNPLEKVSKAPNRNALLFELLQPTTEKDARAGEEYLNKFPKPNQTSEIEAAWLRVRRCFLSLQEWFSDRETRHQVGFLRWARTGGDGVSPTKLWVEFEKQGRRGFRYWLMERVRSVLFPQGKQDRWKEASFEDPNDRHYLQDVLFWFSVCTLPPRITYPFARHASVDTWSLEHIHAQNSPDASNQKQVEQWRDGCIRILKHRLKRESEDEMIQELIASLQTLDCGSSGKAINEEEKTRIEKMLLDLEKRFEGILPTQIHEDLDKLWNLALLGRDENSALSNGFFHQKREKILGFEKDGVFIPPATVRAFLKAFSREPSDLILWAPEDRDAYKERIREVLESTRKDGTLLDV
jgi:hypothetical protein